MIWYTLLKTIRKNKPVTVVKCVKWQDPALDVCDYVIAYLNKTLRYRLRAVAKGRPKPRQLFLSAYTGKPMRRVTIAKYLLKTMALAGIDTACFKSHSARGVGPSLMFRKESSPEKIMAQGNWSSVKTFKRFYNRYPDNSLEGQLILDVTRRKRN